MNEPICPFCGNQVYQRLPFHPGIADCRECMITLPLDVWNRRAPAEAKTSTRKDGDEPCTAPVGNQPLDVKSTTQSAASNATGGQSDPPSVAAAPSGTVIECVYCEGTGSVERAPCVSETCPACKGSGVASVEPSGPSDSEMLDWLEKQKPRIGILQSLGKFEEPSMNWIINGGDKTNVRDTIRQAMERQQ